MPRTYTFWQDADAFQAACEEYFAKIDADNEKRELPVCYKCGGAIANRPVRLIPPTHAGLVKHLGLGHLGDLQIYRNAPGYEAFWPIMAWVDLSFEEWHTAHFISGDVSSKGMGSYLRNRNHAGWIEGEGGKTNMPQISGDNNRIQVLVVRNQDEVEQFQPDAHRELPRTRKELGPNVS